MFLFGDTFLRNFYSVYDMDTKTVSLGIDIKAADTAQMREKDANAVLNYMLLILATVVFSVVVVVLFIYLTKKRIARVIEPKGISESIRVDTEKSKEGFLQGLQ